MTTASQRGWGYPGAPGSVAEGAYRRLFIKTIEVGGVRLAVRREVAHLFVGLITDLLDLGYRLDVNADDWGFANRDIRGRPGVKSNHAWGLAVDLNALTNPMTSGGVITDMPPQTGRLAEKWGLIWGANYTGSRKDAMHMEFTGTPGDVAKYPLGATPIPTPQRWTWEDYMPKPLDRTAALACPTGGYWAQSAEGGIYAYDGAPHLGAYNQHPEWGGSVRYFTALAATKDGGYVQIANDGAFYRFEPAR